MYDYTSRVLEFCTVHALILLRLYTGSVKYNYMQRQIDSANLLLVQIFEKFI